MAKIIFTTEASIHVGRNNFIREGESGAYEVVVFGGTKRYHRKGHLWRNDKLTKDFKDKSSALKYYSELRRKYKTIYGLKAKVEKALKSL